MCVGQKVCSIRVLNSADHLVTRGTRYRDGYLSNEVDFLNSRPHDARRYSTVPAFDCIGIIGGPDNQCHAEIWHPTNRTPGKQCDRQTDGRTNRLTIIVRCGYILSRWWWLRVICSRASTLMSTMSADTRLAPYRGSYLWYALLNSTRFNLCMNWLSVIVSFFLVIF